MDKKHGYRYPRRPFLPVLICAVMGHAKPRRATEVWDDFRGAWRSINPTADVVICSRCLVELND